MRGTTAVRVAEQYVEVGLVLTVDEFECLEELVGRYTYDMRSSGQPGHPRQEGFDELRRGVWMIRTRLREQALDRGFSRSNEHTVQQLNAPVDLSPRARPDADASS